MGAEGFNPDTAARQRESDCAPASLLFRLQSKIWSICMRVCLYLSMSVLIAHALGVENVITSRYLNLNVPLQGVVPVWCVFLR